MHRSSRLRCPYCHETLAESQRVACWSCGALHHSGCWAELGRCAACAEEREVQTARSGRPWTRVRVLAGALSLLSAPLALILCALCLLGLVTIPLALLEGPGRWHNAVEGLSWWSAGMLIVGLPWLGVSATALVGPEPVAAWWKARWRRLLPALTGYVTLATLLALANAWQRTSNGEATGMALGWVVAAGVAWALQAKLWPSWLRVASTQRAPGAGLVEPELEPEAEADPKAKTRLAARCEEIPPSWE